MSDWGEKRFHGRQVFAGLHRRGVQTLDEMTDLPLRLRDQLRPWEPLDLLSKISRRSTSDGTVKILFWLRDGNYIETVRIPEEIHATICLSTQVGCPLDCTFCATGKLGFKRNLTSGEIVDQVVIFQRMTSEPPLRNLVFMGMGEPLLNYDNLVKAIRVFSVSDGLELSQKRMTVSTAGIVPGILKLAEEELTVKMAISLNAPTDTLRNRIMPINRKYPIKEVIMAAILYQKMKGGHITFEYALLPGINDTLEMIKTLREWLIQVPCKLNLIPLNPIGKDRPSRADWDAIMDRFYSVLVRDRIALTLRRSRGAEIKAACGQLAGRMDQSE